MNIKSLLLGSAAGLVAVSGAQAADAIVYAEPEPVEYVRVCDVYGAGFFYIPGTETCLKIGGYVWYQIGTNDTIDTWTKSSRARIDFDARSDTEWGTLRAFARVQGDFNAYNGFGAGGTRGNLANQIGTGDGLGYTGIDQAFIELGGFRAGYTESAWVTSQSAGVAQYGSHSWGGLAYGYQQRQLISYTFAPAGGLAATVSIEDDNNGNYAPDVVGTLSYNQAWGGVWAKVGYDEDNGVSGSSGAGRTGDDGWAAQAGLQVNVPNAPGSSFRLLGFYADNANAYSVGSEWSVLASYRQQFSQTFAASVGAQYFSDFQHVDGLDAWQGEVSLVWTPVTNFEVRGEYTYLDIDGAADATNAGFLRFTRFF